jgi:NAD(P)H-dependent flavin oxidoreductase YrpB (nitropropane dioxygenase family)
MDVLAMGTLIVDHAGPPRVVPSMSTPAPDVTATDTETAAGVCSDIARKLAAARSSAAGRSLVSTGGFA